MKRLFLAFGLLLSPAMAQQFAAADVRPSAPGTRENGGFLPEGRFESRGTTLLKVIAYAYSVNNNQIVGGPDWLNSERFDIEAQAADHTASRTELRKMLQSLLADRFGLVLHDDRKSMPAYLLTLKSGAELHPSSASGPGECPAVDGDPDLIHRVCHAVSMSDLTTILPQIANNYVDRPVVDKTGLDGRFDFQLDWMEKVDYLAAKGVGRPAISIFDALDRLGLLLEPGNGGAPVMVVDRVNRTPTPNPPEGANVALPSEFEAADVRPSKVAGQREWNALPDGEVDIIGYTLRDLVKSAFELKDDRVRGGPKWLDTERFDIIAKSPAAMSPHAVRVMLKALLAERFKLTTHTEDESAPVYALAAGKRAPKLPASDGSVRSGCKLNVAQKGREFVCRNTTMAQLVDRLPDVAQAYFTHPLVDATNIKGAFDFTLTWTPKARLPRVRPSSEPPDPEGDVTVFEALDQQLGLKVEEQQRPQPVIVIDHVEHI